MWSCTYYFSTRVDVNVCHVVWIHAERTIKQISILLEDLMVSLLVGHKMELFVNNMFNIHLLIARTKDLSGVLK